MSPSSAPVGAGVGGMTISFGQVTVAEVAGALIPGIVVNLLVNIKKSAAKAGDAQNGAPVSEEESSLKQEVAVTEVTESEE